jgi:hypothetical protein
MDAHTCFVSILFFNIFVFIVFLIFLIVLGISCGSALFSIRVLIPTQLKRQRDTSEA